MKLTRVKIDNFRSIKSMDFAFPESGFLVLVGANNAGKSEGSIATASWLAG
jgi:putative ATP-dependent endonuclease of OLD family